MKNTLIYLHGFNSASVDAERQLLPGKQKLQLLAKMCRLKDVQFLAPNLDYTEPATAAALLVGLSEGADAEMSPGRVTFIGTSLGGFMAEYVAMLTKTRVIMINPAIYPSQSLRGYIGSCVNYVTAEKYTWSQKSCDLFKPLELELTHAGKLARTLLIDLGDDVLDSMKTVEKYRGIADVHTYPGGCHRFVHMHEALPIIKSVMME